MFVKGVNEVMTTTTPNDDTTPDDDLQLWGRMVESLCEAGLGIDHDRAELVARALVAEVRRERDPERVTYGPGDPLPGPAPQRVVDCDGAVWEHQDADGVGMYQLSVADRVRYGDGDPNDWDGVIGWAFLLDGCGPLTTTPDDGAAAPVTF